MKREREREIYIEREREGERERERERERAVEKSVSSSERRSDRHNFAKVISILAVSSQLSSHLTLYTVN